MPDYLSLLKIYFSAVGLGNSYFKCLNTIKTKIKIG
jgi:hypothetical protein